MDRLVGTFLCSLLAIAIGGCAHVHDLAPCTGGCCHAPSRFFADLLVPPCDQCLAGACSDCGGDPCSCAAPVHGGESCAAPVGESCAAPAGSCESCAAPDLTICKPNLLHAFFGCTGCDGEYYWSEWFSDPPVCHDPCDDCGNWTGYCDSCGKGSAGVIVGPPVEEIAVPY